MHAVLKPYAHNTGTLTLNWSQTPQAYAVQTKLIIQFPSNKDASALILYSLTTSVVPNLAWLATVKLLFP